MNCELWKKIININNYEISNFGNIRNSKNKTLLKKNIKTVITTYIYVNHIDGDKLNNHVNNLEFISDK